MGDAVGLRSERGPVLAAVMLATALVAIDATIVATAVPSIVADIGGFTEFPWLFSVYLLAQAVSVPVYGKLLDLFGRKPIVLAGIALFLIGSIGGGAAGSVGVLIAFRAVQGLGAGAIQPSTITMIGDLYSVRERAKVQGYIAGVWGVSSVLGPALGGLLSEWASWRWIFFVNIPLCLIAAAVIWRHFGERVTRGKPAIDYRGAALLTSGLTLIILGLLEGGQSWAWGSVTGLVVLGGGAALLVAFGFVERTATDPVLPLWVFRRRLLVSAGLTSAGVGAVLLGLTSYVPTYAQTVLGASPLVAGFALAMLLIGWPLSASRSGAIYLRLGFRGCALIGTAIVLAGSLPLLLLDERSSVLQVGAICLFIGVGMGLVGPPIVVAAQASVGWAERGVVTANSVFLRSLGSAIGVAAFGAVANATLRGDDATAGTGTGGTLSGDGASAGAGATPGGSGADPALLTSAVQHIFVGLIVVAALMVVMVLLMPRGDRPGPGAGVSGRAAADQAGGEDDLG
ncbi:MFS transporter [Actinoplanes sp. NPDC051494]|uniref:MFS transporter n=1 Tax=Actinoplanes sp. NPDC051494 TaxID=3363907 RepID=UPI003788F261